MEPTEAEVRKVKALWKVGTFPFVIKGATVEINLGNSIFVRCEPEAMIGLLGFDKVNIYMEPSSD